MIDGATNAVTTFYGLAANSSVGIAVNPVTNKVYLTSCNCIEAGGPSYVTVFDGATTASTTFVVGGFGNTSVPAVNPATNKIYVFNSNGQGYVTVIDGATNVTTNVAIGGFTTAAVNPVTNKVYIAGGFYDNNVTVLTEQQVVPNPLVTTVTPLPGNVTSSPSPTFDFTATSSYAPIAPAVQNVYYQLDTLQGPWLPATGSAPNFSGQPSSLPPGNHVLYFWASDGTDASDMALGETAIGAISAYPFTVVNP